MTFDRTCLRAALALGGAVSLFLAACGGASGGPASGTAGAGAGAGGGTGGASGSGGANGAAGMGGGSGSCDDFSCPDLGTCMVVRDGNGCTRLCTFDPAYSLARADDVAKLAALRCEVIQGALAAGGPELESLAGLETIRVVTGDISLVSVTKLMDLSGLSGLQEAGSIRAQFFGTNAATSLAAIDLPALKSVGFFSLVSDVGATDTVHDIRLPSLETAGDVFITFNPTLVTVSMNALRTVSGLLHIDMNQALLTLNGLPSLVSAKQIEIADNFRLPQCEVSAIVTRAGGTCMRCGGNDNNAVCP